MITLFANNAKTTLASSITSTATSITVASGTGTLFPSPSTGQGFRITLNSVSTPTLYEICICTARSGDTLTVIRGQEGTTASPFSLNDIVGNYDTAATMADLVQSEQLQAQTYLYAVATGTGNALSATIPSNLTAIPDGMSIVVKSTAANTGAATLNLTLGSTVTGAIPIVLSNDAALVGGEIPGAGYPITLSYSSTYGAWVITDGSVNFSLYAPINSPTFTGVPAAPTPSNSDSSTKLATTAYVQNNLANYAPIYSPTLTGTPAAPTASTGTNSTQLATTAFANNAGIGSTVQSYQDVTSSRSQNTVYYNTTGKPIQVYIYETYVNSVGVLVNGSYAIPVGDNTSNSVISFLVPVNGSYELVVNTSISISAWIELR